MPQSLFGWRDRGGGFLGGRGIARYQPDAHAHQHQGEQVLPLQQSLAQVGNVRQPRGGSIRFQAGAQLALQTTGSASEQDSVESDRRRVTSHGNSTGSWYSGTAGQLNVISCHTIEMPLRSTTNRHRDNTGK